MILWGWCSFTWLKRELIDDIEFIYAKSGTVVNDTLVNVTRNIGLEEIPPESIIADRNTVVFCFRNIYMYISSRGVGIQAMMAMGLYRTLGWCNVCGCRISSTESLLSKCDNIRTIIVDIKIIINC